MSDDEEVCVVCDTICVCKRRSSITSIIGTLSTVSSSPGMYDFDQHFPNQNESDTCSERVLSGDETDDELCEENNIVDYFLDESDLEDQFSDINSTLSEESFTFLYDIHTESDERKATSNCNQSNDNQQQQLTDLDETEEEDLLDTQSNIQASEIVSSEPIPRPPMLNIPPFKAISQKYTPTSRLRYEYQPKETRRRKKKSIQINLEDFVDFAELIDDSEPPTDNAHPSEWIRWKKVPIGYYRAHRSVASEDDCEYLVPMYSTLETTLVPSDSASLSIIYPSFPIVESCASSDWVESSLDPPSRITNNLFDGQSLTSYLSMSENRLKRSKRCNDLALDINDFDLGFVENTKKKRRKRSFK